MLLLLFTAAYALTRKDIRDFDPFGGKAVPNTFGRTVCNTIGALKTANHQLAYYRNPPNITYEQEMEELNRVNTMQETDVRFEVFKNEFTKPEWLTVFALHNGFSYCNTTDPLKLSEFGQINPDVPEGLPTGPFRVDSINDFSAYVGPHARPNQDDGRFTISVSDPQQLIVMTWRGSTKTNDFLADSNGTAISLEDEYMLPFRDGNSQILNPKCRVPLDSDSNFFLFAGIAQVMQPHVNDLVIEKLLQIQARYPTYSLVINGHSLGAAKALITGFIISKFYPTKLNLKAVYTFSQPLVGSTAFATWMSECIGIDRVIRIVSGDDLVPWVREAKNVQHPQSIAEIYNPNPAYNIWRKCQGPNDENCSAGKSCLKKDWAHHSIFGGVRAGRSICWYIHIEPMKRVST
jgi:Lipase (class 3)